LVRNGTRAEHLPVAFIHHPQTTVYLNLTMKAKNSNHCQAESFNGLTNESTENAETETRRNSPKKRKSDDIIDGTFEESTNVTEFVDNDSITKPTLLNCRDAFFDQKDYDDFTPIYTPTESGGNKERVIKISKSFFDEDDREEYQPINRYPSRSPTSYRREQEPKPLHSGSMGGTPCGVVDELFGGFYGCMPSLECALPWREHQLSDDDDDLSYHASPSSSPYTYQVHASPSSPYTYQVKSSALQAQSKTVRRDPKDIREHLSFPEHLGREYVSQSEEGQIERKNTAGNRMIRRPRQPSSRPTNDRTIHRTPSSRLTTIETDSRQRLPGSKMIRRTDVNQVTEIHWDEKVLDISTLEQMAAKLSM